MVDIVNLRQARKRKAREQAESEAAQRRVSFGLSKAEKQTARAQRGLSDRRLDAHLIPKPERPDDER